MTVVTPIPRVSESPASIRIGAVGAFVLTFRRPAELVDAIGGMLAQSRRLDSVTILNCDTSEPLKQTLGPRFPGVDVVDLEANVGSAGGFDRALRLAYERRVEWAWLFDDDCMPAPHALSELLRGAAGATGGRVGIVAPVQVSQRQVYGVSFWRDRLVRPRLQRTDPPLDVDVAYWAGMLVNRCVLEEIGFPRPEFFRCFGDYEFCLRARKAGFRVLAVPTSHVVHDHGPPNVVVRFRRTSIRLAYPPSRFYYHVRNWAFTTRFVLRSPKAMLWHLLLQVRLAAGDLVYADRKWERLVLRVRGVVDGFRGHLGHRKNLE